jgi:hypothetical protein
MDDSIAEGWVTNEELAAWLKLVESHIPKIENPKPTTALPEPPDSPGPLGTALAIVSASACRSSTIGHVGSRRMRVRGFLSFLVCTTVSFVAFSFGIWIAGWGAQPKLGPDSDHEGAIRPESVQLILPGTLDGQQIAGRGNGLSDPRRELSPVYAAYPASPGVASRPKNPGEDDQGEAKSSLISGDSPQSAEPAPPERSSSRSLVGDGAPTDANSAKENPTIASLFPRISSLSGPQFAAEEEDGTSASITDEPLPAVSPPRLPPIPDYGDGVAANAARGSSALLTTSSPSEASAFLPVATPGPVQVSVGGSAPSASAKSFQSPSGTAPFPVDSQRRATSSATIVPAGHSKSSAGRPVLNDEKRRPAPDLMKENITKALTFDRRHHTPKIAINRHAPARFSEGTSYGRAAIMPALAGGKLASRMATAGSTDETTSWSHALRRRCPSIITSAEEYDDDLVRLCRLSGGL